MMIDNESAACINFICSFESDLILFFLFDLIWIWFHLLCFTPARCENSGESAMRNDLTWLTHSILQTIHPRKANFQRLQAKIFGSWLLKDYRQDLETQASQPCASILHDWLILQHWNTKFELKKIRKICRQDFKTTANQPRALVLRCIRLMIRWRLASLFSKNHIRKIRKISQARFEVGSKSAMRICLTLHTPNDSIAPSYSI